MTPECKKVKYWMPHDRAISVEEAADALSMQDHLVRECLRHLLKMEFVEKEGDLWRSRQMPLPLEAR